MRSLIIYITVFSTLFVFEGCKKGPNDPAFTVLTRTARLQGIWELSSAEWSHNDTTWIYENMELTISINDSTGAPLPYTKTMNVNRNGSYEIREVFDYPDNYLQNGIPGYALTYIEQGIWNFAGGEGEEPNKSKLLLIKDYLERRLSIAGSDVEAFNVEGPTDGFLFNINELRSDRLVLDYNTVMTNEDGTDTKTGSFIYNKQ